MHLAEYDRTAGNISRLIEMQPGNEENYLTQNTAHNKKGKYELSKNIIPPRLYLSIISI
jgi:hypothetical protein